MADLLSVIRRHPPLIVAVLLGIGIAVGIGVALSAMSVLAPPPSPLLRPFGDNKHWIVSEDLVYRIGDTADYVVVPKGFVTDFASIPQPLWSMGLSPHGQYSRAAVIHDYLYWAQGCVREQADRLMVLAMKESDVDKFDEVAVYAGVYLGGRGSWESNRLERTSGLPRVVPPDYLIPADPNSRWQDYRRFLVAQGVRDPVFDRTPAYCHHGDTTRVPHSSTRAQKQDE
ncbi:DUF1353 domain-containing protein [Methyloversatilis sp. XJ19-49]|uniref:DUF1353 domain-containing protein n=1 Tax=Methyloversatilis sp. XJ19-49 TaxID=2963429 RepID=UPI00211CA982|nr:DUF1353 domain-containing protein [Methyloversatilis sp. XJ19-49]